MEVSFIDLESVKKTRITMIHQLGIVGLLLVSFLALVVLAYFFSNRDNQLIWIIVGSVLTFLIFSSIAYILLMHFRATFALYRFINKAIRSPREASSVYVHKIHNETETFRGIETKALDVYECDDKVRFRVRYPSYIDFQVEIGDKLEIEAYDGILLRVKKL